MNFFPPDVKVRVQGDQKAALELIGEARNLLFRATLRRGDSGLPVRLTSSTPGGSVEVLLQGDLKIITLTAGKGEPVEISHDLLYILCGQVQYGSTYADVDGHRWEHNFHPSLATSLSHQVPYSFSDNQKLADFNIVKKSGAYTGAMRRVVQAVQGLGNIADTSHYLTAPASGKRVVGVQYSPTFLKTHGIYKAGPKNHWLVEIGNTNGILAMPLVLIDLTKEGSYRKHLMNIGDTGGLAVVEEFGGLPSGETFPTGAALTAAIADGKVLQLMTAADLNAAFYSRPTDDPRMPNPSNSPWHSQCGWAFNQAGDRCDNTIISLQQYQLASWQVAFNTYWAARHVTAMRIPNVSFWSSHYTIALTLSPHSIRAARAGDPVGTGDAAIELVHTGLIDFGYLSITGNTMRLPTGGGKILSADLQGFSYRNSSFDPTVVRDLGYEEPSVPLSPELTTAHLPQYIGPEWGATAYVFYDKDDKLVRLKWHPPNGHSDDAVTDWATGEWDRGRWSINTGIELGPTNAGGIGQSGYGAEVWIPAFSRECLILVGTGSTGLGGTATNQFGLIAYMVLGSHGKDNTINVPVDYWYYYPAIPFNSRFGVVDNGSGPTETRIVTSVICRPPGGFGGFAAPDEGVNTFPGSDVPLVTNQAAFIGSF